ncbi:MAG: PilZ domain-containing protein [Nitrospirae bacterium]|nr:PilZ domain-containing protein [Nitrospirota bacterium]
MSFESEEGPGEGVITDISEGGCTIESQRRLRPGLLLRLQFPACTDEEPDRTVLQLGSVRSVHGNRAGVQFVALTPQKQLQLTQTVTRIIRMFADREG